MRLAPVFDNGNAFFNKRNASVIARRLANPALLEEDALHGLSFFLDDEDHHIHPFRFLQTTENVGCLNAVERFVRKVDMPKILSFIDAIPASAFGKQVISDEQRAFYKALLQETYMKGILPVAERLQKRA